MNAATVILWLLDWSLVAVPFELAYWAVSRVATCKLPKHELCGIYWLVAGFAVLVVLDRSIGGPEFVLAALVCGVHLALCDQFSKLERRKVGHRAADPAPHSPCCSGHRGNSQAVQADDSEAEQ